VSKPRRTPFVALITLLRRRFPDVGDPEQMVRRGLILVNDAPVWNPRARVRADASMRLVRVAPLRGTVKLKQVLRTLAVDVTGCLTLDLGAAAGGFTQALLDAGARRVYAVDAGVGQLRGAFRNDSRVINLERTNLSQLSRCLIPDLVDIVTMDLSYLAIADALPQIGDELLAPEALLIALVKPTYELHAATLAARSEDVGLALLEVRRALGDNGWQFLSCASPSIQGAHGAVEMFVLARRMI
jgi:23S rRNA (cytidine1920-2'-O)/16S rRNA (cytidine1409-2'-O)-methyltransferase